VDTIDLGGGFTVTGHECEGYVCWRVTGCLDVYRTPRLMQAVHRACLRGRRHHLIDLSEVWAADASAVRELVRLHKLLSRSGRLAVTAPRDAPPRTLLRTTRADQILEVYEYIADADRNLRSRFPIREMRS
jgi:anti-anti-sigma regulatory factor